MSVVNMIERDLDCIPAEAGSGTAEEIDRWGLPIGES
jgi:hypothetical protein